MDSPRPGLDLEKELTCSICTELLYQPLTLLDCLHTFCGSCLKEWFSHQATTVERSPNPPTPGSNIFNCPSCRASVRDTRHNATVVTLLDMLVTVHPEKGRSQSDKDDMARKYKPGDQVIPKVNIRERTADERRADNEDRRLLDSVRDMSLREASGAPPLPPRTRRRGDSRSRSSGDTSSDTHQRRARDAGHRSRREDPTRQSPDQLMPDENTARRRRSESRQRQVEHQQSLRSLISSADMSERDIEREIDEFARQIQEEGLLDGLDLDNIDLSRDDELSRRITEAYRRRQRGRTRSENTRRSNTSAHRGSSRPVELSRPSSRPPATTSGSRSSSRAQGHPRSASASGHGEDRSRPPPSMSANLEVRDATGRARRRTGSGARSTTAPIVSLATSPTPRRASQSQTDLSLPPQSLDVSTPRPSFSEGRSASTPNVPASNPPPLELPGSIPINSGLQSFANRSQGQRPTTPPELSGNTESRATGSNGPRGNRPAELAVVHSAMSNPLHSPTAPGHQRKRSHLYPEPSISCSRCHKTHIEYDVHYNCHICSNGQYNICLNCYRQGKGCLYWFGFGYGAWQKWEKARQANKSLAPPHMLTASRYAPPPSTPGGADGRKTLTMDNPRNRLESGTFCVRCFIWTNECYWRCDTCNEGDWGFCNNCVNQGKSCTHQLLPLTHEASSHTHDPPCSPRSPGRPPTATVLTGPLSSNIGPFKPLTFNTRCDVCQDPMRPTEPRYHCFSCTSALAANAETGDYDICFSCYNNLVAHGEISFENGHSGWRRCLSGHRMAIVGFIEGKVGLWRYVDRDIVGGRALRAEPYDSAIYSGQGLQKWSWTRADQKLERLVTRDVKAMAPTVDGPVAFAQSFPPDGGAGTRAIARWSWYPQAGAEDELLFPRGAEVREIEDVNGDWFFGSYMGANGLFPAPYVRMG